MVSRLSDTSFKSPFLSLMPPSFPAMSRLLKVRQGTHRALDDCIAAMDVYECAKSLIRRQDLDFAKVYRAGKRKRAKIKA